jgi:sec-independent protein translocase protein TatB
MAVIAVVALVVIGPKDLPRVMRTVGMWVGRARAVAREFQSSLDQMIREAELDEMKKQVEKAASLDIGQEIQKTIDPGNELQKQLDEPAFTENTAKPAPPAGDLAPGPGAAPAQESQEPRTEAEANADAAPATGSDKHG